MATASRVPLRLTNADQIIETVFNASVSGIAIYDQNRRCAAINRVLADIDGFPAEAHIGKTISEILGPVGEQIRPKLESAFESREPVFFEVTAKLPTRKEMGCWDVKYIPLIDRKGTVIQVCAIVTELTNRRGSCESPEEESLPRREREVMCCLAEGKSNKETALHLGLSVRTVETYRARVMLKLKARSTADLVRYAVRHKLIEA